MSADNEIIPPILIKVGRSHADDLIHIGKDRSGIVERAVPLVRQHHHGGAVEVLGPDIRSVHVKDANRPTTPGEWGEEVPLEEGQVNIRRFVQALKQAGYEGPLIIEREAGNQEARIRDCAAGIRLLRAIVAED